MERSTKQSSLVISRNKVVVRRHLAFTPLVNVRCELYVTFMSVCPSVCYTRVYFVNTSKHITKLFPTADRTFAVHIRSTNSGSILAH